jgi:hypothetical protein
MIMDVILPHSSSAHFYPLPLYLHSGCAALRAFPKGKATVYIGHLRISGESLTVAVEIIAPFVPKTVGVIPDYWKISCIQPLPKKGDYMAKGSLFFFIFLLANVLFPFILKRSVDNETPKKVSPDSG